MRERSGGTVRVRGTVAGVRADVYQASCDVHGCTELGPESPGSARGARQLAAAVGWECVRIRVRGLLMESRSWRVRCPVHRSTTASPP